MDADLLNNVQNLSVEDKKEMLEEIVEYLKFGKTIFTSSFNFFDTKQLLEGLKLTAIEPHLLPPAETMKGFYALPEIMTVCKKNDVQQLLYKSMKTLLDYVLKKLTESQQLNATEFTIQSLLNEITSCIEALGSKESRFTTDLSVLVVDFVGALFNLSDKTYTNGLNKERVDAEHTKNLSKFILCLLDSSHRAHQEHRAKTYGTPKNSKIDHPASCRQNAIFHGYLRTKSRRFQRHGTYFILSAFSRTSVQVYHGQEDRGHAIV